VQPWRGRTVQRTRDAHPTDIHSTVGPRANERLHVAGPARREIIVGHVDLRGVGDTQKSRRAADRLRVDLTREPSNRPRYSAGQAVGGTFTNSDAGVSAALL
jgi:hypothetical protein